MYKVLRLMYVFLIQVHNINYDTGCYKHGRRNPRGRAPIILPIYSILEKNLAPWCLCPHNNSVRLPFFLFFFLVKKFLLGSFWKYLVAPPPKKKTTICFLRACQICFDNIWRFCLIFTWNIWLECLFIFQRSCECPMIYIHY